MASIKNFPETSPCIESNLKLRQSQITTIRRPQPGWTQINLKNHVQIAELGDVLRAAYETVKNDRIRQPKEVEPESGQTPTV